MIRKLDILIPPFLKKIDKDLLLNHPGIWSTKVHFVLFYVLLGMAFSTLLAMIQVNIKNLSDPDHTVFMFIPAIAGLIFWLFRVVQFNVERGFGMSSGVEMLKRQAIYGLCVLMFAALPFYHGYMVGYFNANVLSDQELAEDINVINLGYANLTLKPNQPAPNYQNWTPVDYVHTRGVVMITGKDLYIRWNRMSRNERIELIDDYQRLLEKFSGYHAIPSVELIRQYHSEDNLNNIGANRFFYETRDAIDDINFAKRELDRNFGFGSEVLSITVFMIFLVWLVSMIAIRTNRKHSLTAIVIGILLLFANGMLTGLSAMLFDARPENTILVLFFGTLMFLLLQSFSTRNSRKINFWKSVGLILAVVMTPFIFIVWASFGSDHPGVEFVSYGGVILTIIMWNFIYSKQFIALKAAPSQD